MQRNIFHWAGHIIRREDEALIKQVWKETPKRRRPPGYPKKRWKDQELIDIDRMTTREENAVDGSKWS